MIKFFKKLFKNVSQFNNSLSNYKLVTNKTFISSKAYVNWGIHLANKGNIEEAIKKFESSSYMRPLNPESFNNWGIALATMEKYEEAINSLNPVYEEFPETYTVNFRLGWLYYLDKKYANAMEHLQKALKIYPSSVEAMNTMDLIFAAKEEWNWNPKFDLDAMTKDMLTVLKNKIK